MGRRGMIIYEVGNVEQFYLYMEYNYCFDVTNGEILDRTNPIMATIHYWLETRICGRPFHSLADNLVVCTKLRTLVC